MSDETTTPIDRLEFIRQLLQSAPAGQFNIMLDDIQKLVGGSLDADLLQDIQNSYQQRTCSIPPDANSNNSNNFYTDASSHPLTGPLQNAMEGSSASATTNDESNASSTSSCKSINRRAITPGPDANTLLLRTYTEQVDDVNCRTGYWTAEWTIVCNTTECSQAQISGQVSICAFSFEDGNIQCRSTKSFGTITLHAVTKDEEEDNNNNNAVELMAMKVAQQISQFEANVLKNIKDSYIQARQNLKSIRGILPITHTRLNWNVVTQRTVRNLQETVNK